jgi:hypothetical protein
VTEPSKTPERAEFGVVGGSALFCALIVAGFAYVSVVLCGRSDPLLSGNDTRLDLAFVLALAPPLYLLGPRENFRIGPAYVLPFFAALHFEYLGRALGVAFSLKSADLSSLSPRAALALAAAALGIGALLAWHFVLARRAKILGRYAAAFAAVPLAVAAITWRLRETHYLHVHHYCLGTYLFPFFRFDRTLSRAAHAVFLGIAVEGVSRWGMDPVWYCR